MRIPALQAPELETVEHAGHGTSAFFGRGASQAKPDVSAHGQVREESEFLKQEPYISPLR